MIRQTEDKKREQAAAVKSEKREQDWLRVTQYLNSLTELERCSLIDKAIVGNDWGGYIRKYRAHPETNSAGEMFYREAVIKHVLPLLPVEVNV